MRQRFLLLLSTLALTGALFISAPPAAAVYSVTIEFPGGSSEFYSPFSGPAKITANFTPGDPDVTFELRIRLVGGALIKTGHFFVDGDDPDGTQSKNFVWPALSTTSDKTYAVSVLRGGNIVAKESFQLHPPLVRITNIAPNPFLPLIDDGHKDNTTVTFDLQAGASAEARVFRAKSNGNCCGNLVRNDATGLNNLPAGLNQWVWDGKNNNNNEAGLGNYYVKIWADDGVVAPTVSKPKKVTIGRYYYESATAQKSATAYHHVGPVTAYLRGGNCFLTNAQTDLWITCLHAKFTIYWRWSIPAGASITKVSWTFIPVSGDICKYTKGHSGNDSWMRAGTTSGQVRCRIDLAKITYAKPIPS